VRLIERRVTIASLRLGSRKEFGEEVSIMNNPAPTIPHPASRIPHRGAGGRASLKLPLSLSILAPSPLPIFDF
jgi:hypothetical protein